MARAKGGRKEARVAGGQGGQRSLVWDGAKKWAGSGHTRSYRRGRRSEMTLRMIGIHSLPKAAIPKYHKVGGFKQRDLKGPRCFYSGDGSISRLTPLLIQLLG